MPTITNNGTESWRLRTSKEQWIRWVCWLIGIAIIMYIKGQAPKIEPICVDVIARSSMIIETIGANENIIRPKTKYISQTPDKYNHLDLSGIVIFVSIAFKLDPLFENLT